MRVLFDQGARIPLRRFLTRHEVTTAYDHGWSRLTNGELLDGAERERFDVLVSTDMSLTYQQHLPSRRIALVVLSTPSWRRIERAVTTVVQAADRATPGSYVEVEIS